MAELLGTPEICPRHPVMLIGGNGTVGFPLAEMFRTAHGPSSVIQASRTGEVPLDITRFETVYSVLRSTQPAMIVLLAAMTNVNACESQSQAAWEANCHGVMNAVAVASSLRYPPALVYTSTDFVFPGTRETAYLEQETPDPLSVYGRTKYAGEIAVQSYHGRKLILRISYPWHTAAYHLEHPSLKDTLKWIAATLLAGKDVPAFDNVIGNWTPMQPLAKGFWEIVHRATSAGDSILHIGGTVASPFEVATAIHTFLQESSSGPLGNVIRKKFEPTEGIAPRPAQGGLDVTRASQLGITFDPILVSIANREWMKAEEIEPFRQAFVT